MSNLSTPTNSSIDMDIVTDLYCCAAQEITIYIYLALFFIIIYIKKYTFSICRSYGTHLKT